jgi:COMPASS component SWD3
VYTPNSEFILAGTLDHRLRLWTVGTTGTPTRCVKTYKGHVNDKYSIFSAFCLTNGQHIVSGSEDNKVMERHRLGTISCSLKSGSGT